MLGQLFAPMNLRDQLKTILPDILPATPVDSIKGTELIELVKYRLHQNYSDATLRYHFSIMSCDPSSPIAKVEQGQGYYLRTTTIHSLHSARNLITPSQGLLGEKLALSDKDVDISMLRANKFRALFQRFCEARSHFPFIFERSFSDSEAGANRWRYPDAAIVEWLVGEIDDEQGFVLDQDQMKVQRMLGSAPFRVTSVKLKLELSYSTLREDLFQCLSTSDWADSGDLIVAAPIDDEQMIEDIRNFGNTYGIGVSTFGMEADALDDMPEPATIHRFLTREFEAIQSLFTYRRITSPRSKHRFDWQKIRDNRNDNPDFSRFEQWISRCLADEKSYSINDFLELTPSHDASASGEDTNEAVCA